MIAVTGSLTTAAVLLFSFVVLEAIEVETGVEIAEEFVVELVEASSG